MNPDPLNLALGFAVLAVVYVLLGLELLPRPAVAIVGAGLVVGLNIVLHFTSFRTLLEGVDLDTILLLMCMMSMVGVLSRTGVFDYIASRMLVKFCRKPFVLVVVLSSFTAVVSAFIDNVTTVLLVSPVVISLCRRLGIDPRPLLLSVVFASNIGGTATLIGDPPNILIGSVAKLGFMEFIRNLTPIVVIDFIAFIALTKLLFRSWFTAYRRQVKLLGLSELHHPTRPIEKSMLKKVLIAFTIAISLFFLEDIFKYPPAIPSMIGAGVLMLLLRKSINLEDVIKDIDWPTLVFFMGMFIVIKGVEELGVIRFIANSILASSQDLKVLLMLILWISAIASALIDNIPFVMSMIPVISIISTTLNIDPRPLYWALSLGGCLGGNGTLIGASANVVVAGIADKHGYHISFTEFLKYGMPVMLTTVGLSAPYLILRYAM
ncbi:MAG: hypothetical protein DRJ40_02090 [Thermoprotei archaeon]|nr:MAG: hypothetical protein DRJ40_02090 [Thermoprotei archaeon]